MTAAKGFALLTALSDLEIAPRLFAVLGTPASVRGAVLVVRSADERVDAHAVRVADAFSAEEASALRDAFAVLAGSLHLGSSSWGGGFDRRYQAALEPPGAREALRAVLESERRRVFDAAGWRRDVRVERDLAPIANLGRSGAWPKAALAYVRGRGPLPPLPEDESPSSYASLLADPLPRIAEHWTEEHVRLARALAALAFDRRANFYARREYFGHVADDPERGADRFAHYLAHFPAGADPLDAYADLFTRDDYMPSPPLSAALFLAAAAVDGRLQAALERIVDPTARRNATAGLFRCLRQVPPALVRLRAWLEAPGVADTIGLAVWQAAASAAPAEFAAGLAAQVERRARAGTTSALSEILVHLVDEGDPRALEVARRYVEVFAAEDPATRDGSTLDWALAEVAAREPELALSTLLDHAADRSFVHSHVVERVFRALPKKFRPGKAMTQRLRAELADPARLELRDVAEKPLAKIGVAMKALPAIAIDQVDATFKLPTDIARFFLYDPVSQRGNVSELDEAGLAKAMKRGAVCGFDTMSDGFYCIRVRGERKPSGATSDEPMIMTTKSSRLRLDNGSGGARTLHVPPGMYRVDVRGEPESYVVSLAPIRAKPRRVASRLPQVVLPPVD